MPGDTTGITPQTGSAFAGQSIPSGHDGALLTARLTTRRRPGELVGASRFIHVYVWREGRWQILAAQGSSLATPG